MAAAAAELVMVVVLVPLQSVLLFPVYPLLHPLSESPLYRNKLCASNFINLTFSNSLGHVNLILGVK